MHKPDPALPPDQQDKRAVIPIERADVEQWLVGSAEDARALMRVPAVGLLEAGPIAAAPRGGNASSPLG